MRRGRRQHEEPVLFRALTPNQVVAFNLAAARTLKGWTQDEAADALAPYLGSRWSKATFSAAERSIERERIRQFDADEIVAFARAFELPVTWFFMPPPPWAAVEDRRVPVKLAAADAQRFGRELALLIDLVFGDEAQQSLLEQRLRGFLDELGPAQSDLLTQSQQRIADLVERRLAAMIRHSFGDIQGWQQTLRAISNKLEDLQRQAESGLRADVDEQGLPPGGPTKRSG